MDSNLKKTLKAKAHHLHPVVLMGSKGLTEAVIAETDIALTAHELIKIKLVNAEKKEQMAIIEQLCQGTHAELVQFIGHIAIIYRKNPDNR